MRASTTVEEIIIYKCVCGRRHEIYAEMKFQKRHPRVVVTAYTQESIYPPRKNTLGCFPFQEYVLKMAEFIKAQRNVKG